MNILKSRKSHALAIAALLFATTTPVLADSDDGCFGEKASWAIGLGAKNDEPRHDGWLGFGYDDGNPLQLCGLRKGLGNFHA